MKKNWEPILRNVFDFEFRGLTERGFTRSADRRRYQKTTARGVVYYEIHFTMFGRKCDHIIEVDPTLTIACPPLDGWWRKNHLRGDANVSIFKERLSRLARLEGATWNLAAANRDQVVLDLQEKILTFGLPVLELATDPFELASYLAESGGAWSPSEYSPPPPLAFILSFGNRELARAAVENFYRRHPDRRTLAKKFILGMGPESETLFSRNEFEEAEMLKLCLLHEIELPSFL